ncbi:spiralin repeat-containing protein [Spiroplasma eriocheiris]|uniref:Spiralin n=1 Tax=Spiroplasma eriocheiris TaxID=315358 RepID=A0A0H3XMA1_9MOLU|nr:spiralin repeat-containing protein [Spiroplasma eriocheiris]AHF57565.1 hypothetical protein SPE_0436 [Spiroplasma eriocheiris CCTCC M 207170]AKM54022.1 hypothetical protein SERIO_v1c04430 [Spiroplasma eriocheiris]
MKKLLAILGAVGLTATGASSVVACSNSDKSEPTDELTNLSSYNDKQKEQISVAISNAIANTANKAAGEKTEAYKAINDAVIDSLKHISEVEALNAVKVQINILDENKEEFTTHHAQFSDGDKIIVNIKALDGSELTGSLEVSLTVTSKVQQQDLTNLKVSIDPIEVEDNTKVTDTEANDAKDKVIKAISEAVKKLQSTATDKDYTVDGIDNIKAGDLSKGVTLTVKAVDKSELLKGSSSPINVKFNSQEVKKTDLGIISVQPLAISVSKTDKLAASDVDFVKTKVQGFVKTTLEDNSVSGAIEGTYYDINGLESIKAGQDISKGLKFTITAKDDSKILTGKREFNVTFKQQEENKDQGLVNAIKAKVDAISGEKLTISPEGNDQPAAETVIEKLIDGEISEAKADAEVKYGYADFKAPTADESGSIKVTVTITKGAASATSKELTFTINFHQEESK